LGRKRARTWEVAVLAQQGIEELHVRGRMKLADASFVEVASVDEDTRARGRGVLQEGVELEGRDERAGSGDERRVGRQSDEVRDDAHGERGEAGGEGEVRGHAGQGGGGRVLEVDGRAGEARVRPERGGVRAQGGERAGDGDVDAVGRHAEAAAQGERGAEVVEEERVARGAGERDELVIEQHAPLLRTLVVVGVGVGGGGGGGGGGGVGHWHKRASSSSRWCHGGAAAVLYSFWIWVVGVTGRAGAAVQGAAMTTHPAEGLFARLLLQQQLRFLRLERKFDEPTVYRLAQLQLGYQTQNLRILQY
jgi:hypothetical protein